VAALVAAALVAAVLTVVLALELVLELELEAKVEAVMLLVRRDLSSSGHSRALPFLGIHPTPVEEQLAVEGQASIRN
jgi:hypothetical protein